MSYVDSLAKLGLLFYGSLAVRLTYVLIILLYVICTYLSRQYMNEYEYE